MREGFIQDGDAGAGVKEERDWFARIAGESEAEKGVWVSGDDVGVQKSAAIGGRAVDLQDGAVGAEYEWVRAEDGDKTVVAEACFGENIFIREGKDDGWGEVGGRSRDGGLHGLSRDSGDGGCRGDWLRGLSRDSGDGGEWGCGGGCVVGKGKAIAAGDGGTID